MKPSLIAWSSLFFLFSLSSGQEKSVEINAPDANQTPVRKNSTDFCLEYQIWPIYNNFFEKNENKHYKSFDVWNEFRVGYGFDFTFSNCPLFLNVQWPFGFGLYGSNKPESFKDENSGSKKYFYFPPLVFIGIRF